MKKITIRNERPEDLNEILKLTYRAFLSLDYPGRKKLSEHYLVHLLQGSEFVIPELCFTADTDGKLAGHIIFTESKVTDADGSEVQTVTFGPLSVLPEYQRQGIGTALVNHSLKAAKSAGYGAVLITGVPEYYPRLGFRRAREFGLSLEDGTSPDAFMAYELIPGYLRGGGTLHFSAQEFIQCETDTSGYEKFHRTFMKENYPSQIVLRPFREDDVHLLERWLYEPHAAEWFMHPQHWLNEVKKRHTEFSFLSHFIAEYEGVPIGFCQYYDCYYSAVHEVWHDEWKVSERSGEIFSIDYLIGETKYLKKGYGKEIVRLLTEEVRRHGAKMIIVSPEKDNIPSAKVLEANGYKYNGEDYFIELVQD